MALSYTTSNQLTYVDAVLGTAANQTGIKSLVPKVVDRNYHKQVLSKSFFTVNGMIGEDSYMEGGVSETASGFPVIRKTQLNGNPGSNIEMGLKRKLTADHKTGGKIGNAQLVDNEVSPDMYNLNVEIEEWRQGVRMFTGINAQRNPYSTSIKQIGEDSLRDWQAEQLDTALLYSLWAGWSPHVIRAYGVTSCPVTANPNTLFGNDTLYDTSGTIADILGTSEDALNASTFEIGMVFAQEHNFDLVDVGGEKYLIALVSARGHLKLLNDDKYRTAVNFANSGRGTASNPLFKYATAIYANCLIFTYDKVRSILGGLNPAGITVGSSEITEADYTGIGGGVTAAQLHPTFFLAANAVAHADVAQTITDRKEDDYGKISGTGISMIFGSRRTDWSPEVSGDKYNQSSLVIMNHLL